MSELENPETIDCPHCSIKLPDPVSMMRTAVRKTYDERKRQGVHISDLSTCIRRAVWHRLKPAPITNRDVRNFNQGKSHHASVQDLFKSMQEMNMSVRLVKAEKEVVYKGIVSHPDLLLIVNNELVIELKGTRSSKSAKSKHYETQLRDYMAVLGMTHGILMIESYNAQEDVDIWKRHAYHMTEPDRVERLKDLENRAKIFLNAVESKDQFLAPPVMYDPEMIWLCHTTKGKDKNTITYECPYKRECWMHEVKAGRASVTSEHNQLISIENSKVEKKTE